MEKTLRLHEVAEWIRDMNGTVDGRIVLTIPEQVAIFAAMESYEPTKEDIRVYGQWLHRGLESLRAPVEDSED